MRPQSRLNRWAEFATLMFAASAIFALGAGRAAGRVSSSGPRGLDTAHFHYAEAGLSPPGRHTVGLTARLSVALPQRIQTADHGDSGHSLAEIAVRGPGAGFTYLEAGWIVSPGGVPTLFVNHWVDGVNDGNGGFVATGPGPNPHVTPPVGSYGLPTALHPGTYVTLTYRHRDRRWWLQDDGQQSAYFSDRVAHMRRIESAVAFGEVEAPRTPNCTEMGSGLPARNPDAASFTHVAWLGGPRMQVSRATVDQGYTLKLTGRNAFRYGGPGPC